MNEQLDPSIINLVKAIGKSESGGNYNAKGKSGEFGAYQFMPSTWKVWAKKFLGDANAQMTKENQDKVAYSQIKEWGQQGLKPSQIASMWNSGKPNWQGNVGTNKAGVQYDTPSYVKKVGDTYASLMKGENPSQVQTSSTVSSDQLGQQDDRPTLKDKVIGGGKLAVSLGEQLLGKLAGSVPGQEGLATKLNSLSDSNYSDYKKTQPQQTFDSNGKPTSGGGLSQFATGVASVPMWIAKQIGDAIGIKPTKTGQRIYDSSRNLDAGGYKAAGQASAVAMPLVAAGVGALAGGAPVAATTAPGLLKTVLGLEAGQVGADIVKNKAGALWNNYIGGQIPGQTDSTIIRAAPR